MNKSFKFNPGFQSDEEAVSSFIVRRAEYDHIIGRLSPGEQRFHIIVVAPRGAGKTTLCRRVLAEVRRSSALEAAWMPIFLGEESYSVTTPGEFLLECLFHLADDPEASFSAEEYQLALRIEDEKELLRHCRDTLARLAAANGKRFLIIVENLHMIVRDQLTTSEDELLEILLDEKIFGVLATAVRSDDDDGLTGFEYLALDPLDLDECHELWIWLTDQQVDKARIRPLQILTGGSPRLLHILAEFMKTPSLRDLMDNLNFLIDQNTEYFKSQLDALPSQERKVFVALLEAWDPSSAKRVADGARVSVNTASALLNRLHDRGAVVKQAGTGRAVLYQAAERLFNIYYLMRRRSHPSSRVRTLVAFMTQYYDRDELVDTTSKIAIEACMLEPSGRGDYHSAYSAILEFQPESIRSAILRRTPSEFLESLVKEMPSPQYSLLPEMGTADQPEINQNVLEELMSDVRGSLQDTDLEQASDLIAKAIETWPDSYETWMFLAMVKMSGKAAEEALEAAKKAVQLGADRAIAHAVLGLTLSAVSRNEEAEASHEHALSLDPNCSIALLELAQIRRNAGRDSEALSLFRRTVAEGTLPAYAARMYADLLADEPDGFEEAETALAKTLEEEPTSVVAAQSLADLYLRNDRADEGAALLRDQAVRTGSGEQWTLLSTYLSRALHDPAATIEASRTAIERQETTPHLFWVLAKELADCEAQAEEIEYVAGQLLAAHANDNEEVLVTAGQIFELADNIDEAIRYYRAATELDEAGGYPYFQLGRALTLLSRMDEAEAAFRQMIEVEGEDTPCGAVKDLAELRVHRGDDTEAAMLLEESLGRNEKCVCSLVLLASVAERRGDPDRAVELIDKALGVTPHYPAALAMKALLSKDDDEAIALIESAVSDHPDDPTMLLARGRLESRKPLLRIADLERAIELDPSLVEARLDLVVLHARFGKADEALEQLAHAMQAVPARMEIIPRLVDGALHLVRSGYGPEVLEIMSGENGKYVEPLIVAVQIHAGEKPVVASEILEVAYDILEQLKSIR